MPVKLTSTDYKVIGICAAVAAISLAIGVKYFWRAFPEAAIEFRVNRDDSAPLAERFLADRGFHVDGYRHAAIFDFDDNGKVYLERTQGLERMNRLTRGPLRLWRWSHRWFKPQQKEEFRVDVAPSGEIAGFDHEIPESAPGAKLDSAAARAVAEQFLTGVMKRNLSDLEFVETESEKRPARTDHSFTWKQKNVDLGDGSLRVKVEVDGDQVAGYREFVKVPEQWQRDYSKLRSRNNAAQVVDQVFWILLSVAMLIMLIQRLRDRDVPMRLSSAFGLVAAVLFFLGQLNTFSLAQFGYRTTDSYSSFVTGYVRDSLLSALGLGAAIFLLVAGAEPVYRQHYPHLISLRRYLSWQGLRTRSFFLANVVGIGLTFFFFAYQTVFYLAAEKLGAWAPAEVPFTDLLNTRVPWVTVLFIGFFPAVSEEMQFRAFSIPFLHKLLRSKFAGVVLSAFIWGFLHSAYPNQPFFIRGIEVGVGGIVTGLIMLRFGILATLVWHYSVDALYTAFLLLRSPNHYLMFSGGLAAGLMLVPLAAALIAYGRKGTFTEESALTNANDMPARPLRKEAEAAREAPLVYQALPPARLVLAGVLTLAFLGVAAVPVYRFGKGVTLQVPRAQALRAADDFLRGQHVDPGGYHRVAGIFENVDALALRYLLERKTILESDQIYRQATRLALWQVRYFRPLQKEEYLAFVDVTTGQVFGYRHLLDEDAPGASLQPDQAQALAAQALEEHGYRLSDFELQNSQAQRRKARQDYTLTWQAKAGDPRNVAEALYRVEVQIAGDQVLGLSRSFKLPEDWERKRAATHLTNSILAALSYVVLFALVGAGLIVLVRQIRAGQIAWRKSAWVGAGITLIAIGSELNQIPILDQRYPTSIPLATFHLYAAVGFIVLPLLYGLGAWLLVGLATSLYPDAWRVFRGSDRAVWRRDAALALVVSLAADTAFSRGSALMSSRFHALMPVSIGLFPASLSVAVPGIFIFCHALIFSVFYASLIGVALYVIRQGWLRRAWWLWVGGALVLADLGSESAHSVPEYLLDWGMTLILLVVAALIVALFLRRNVLAYVAAAFGLLVAEPLTALFSQPASFCQWNGLVLALLTLVVVGWMFLTGGPSRSPSQAPSS